jgi:hypothetical protein
MEMFKHAKGLLHCLVMDTIISHGSVTLFNEQHEQSWAELCEAMKGVVSR